MYLLDRTQEGNAKLKKVAAEIDPDTEIQINKVTANTTVTLNANHLLLTWRRYNLTVPLDQPASDPMNNQQRKYWAFKCFHAKGGSGPITINGTEASPSYYIDYIDASADDNNIMLCMKDITKPGWCFMWDGITAFTDNDISMSQAMLDAGLWDFDSYFARLFPPQ